MNNITIQFVGAYAAYLAVSNLIWEVVQLPLYQVWYRGSPGEISYNIVHCTLGDVLIGLVSFGLAVGAGVALRRGRLAHNRVIICIAVLFGVIYTLFSEWLNASILQSWSYSELMPTITVAGVTIGVSPIAQWMILPTFFLVYRFGRRAACPA